MAFQTNAFQNSAFQIAGGSSSELFTGSGFATVQATTVGTGYFNEGDVFLGSGYLQVKAQSFGAGIALDTDSVIRNGYASVNVGGFGSGFAVDLDTLAQGSGFSIAVAIPSGTGFSQETGDSSDTAFGSGYSTVNVTAFGAGTDVQLDVLLGNGNTVVLATAFGAGTWSETSAPTPDVFIGSGFAIVNATAFGSGISIDNGGGWGVPSVLFTEAEPIIAIALTFDQLGRPIVFYQTVDAELKLYWFDPVAGQNVTQYLTDGQWPTAAFDYINNVNYTESDAWIFYVKGLSVYSRLQRERWAVEHLVRTYASEPIIRSAGYTKGGRLQVVVDTLGACPVSDTATSPVDTVTLGLAFAGASLLDSYTPIPVDPVDPPVIEDPDPPVIVDPPIVVRPTTPQGYFCKYPDGGAWITNSGFVGINSLFRFTIKSKIPIDVSYNPSYLLCQSALVVTSSGYTRRSSYLTIYAYAGKIRCNVGSISQETPILWSGKEMPKCKIQFQRGVGGFGVLRFWEELADGSYGPVQEYQFPAKFEQPAGDMTEYSPYEKMGIGGIPESLGVIKNPCNGVIRDFVFEEQSPVTQAWSTLYTFALDDWNNPYQGIFMNPNHKSPYWVEVTGA